MATRGNRGHVRRATWPSLDRAPARRRPRTPAQRLQVPEELDVREEEHAAVDAEPGTEDDRRRGSRADREAEEEGDTDDRQQSGGRAITPAQELFELVAEGQCAGIDPVKGTSKTPETMSACVRNDWR